MEIENRNNCSLQSDFSMTYGCHTTRYLNSRQAVDATNICNRPVAGEGGGRDEGCHHVREIQCSCNTCFTLLACFNPDACASGRSDSLWHGGGCVRFRGS